MFIDLNHREDFTVGEVTFQIRPLSASEAGSVQDNSASVATDGSSVKLNRAGAAIQICKFAITNITNGPKPFPEGTVERAEFINGISLGVLKRVAKRVEEISVIDEEDVKN